jgi:tetratricopeptide (TPR) repeat protein
MPSKQTRIAVVVALLLLAGSIVVVVLMSAPAKPLPLPARAPEAPKTPVVLPLGDPKLHAAQGQRLARRGEFAEAVEQYKYAMASEPDKHWYWYLTACLLAETGDAAAHHAHCREMLANFGGAPESYIIERITRASLLLPQPQADLLAAQSMIDRVLSQNVPPTQLPWVHLAKGMAEYRAGRFEQSTDWLIRTRDSADLNYASGKIMADLFLAMAYSRRGDVKMARESLASAEDRIETQMPRLNRNGAGGDNDQWLNFNVALREARLTLDGSAAGPAGK